MAKRKAKPKEESVELDGDDILADIRNAGDDTLAEFRARMAKNDLDAVVEAVELWFMAAGVYAGDLPVRPVSDIWLFQFRELTWLLTWWCDTSKFNIDATPLMDFLILRDQAWIDDAPAPDAFHKHQIQRRALDVAMRIMYVMHVSKGLAPPTSRNPDRDAYILRELREGKLPDEIRMGIKQHPGWYPISTDQGVYEVKYRHEGRSRK